MLVFLFSCMEEGKSGIQGWEEMEGFSVRGRMERVGGIGAETCRGEGEPLPRNGRVGCDEEIVIPIIDAPVKSRFSFLFFAGLLGISPVDFLLFCLLSGSAGGRMLFVTFI